MRIVAVVQARMTSTRLPGKVLMPLAGKPMVYRVFERVKAIHYADEQIVAIPDNDRNDELEKYLSSECIPYYAGSEHDLISRLISAAEAADPLYGAIVRITADCPFVDPTMADELIWAYFDTAHLVDYASNVLPRTYPRGFDIEVYSRKLLRLIDLSAKTPEDRENFSTYLWEQMTFSYLEMIQDPSLADIRLTVDTEEDYELARNIYSDVYDEYTPFYTEAVEAYMGFTLKKPRWEMKLSW